MEQKPMSIYNFKRGDVITRLEPSAPHPAGEAMGFEGDEVRDRAYIGAALTFLGIANGCVNVERWEKPENQNPLEKEMGLPSFGSFMKLLSGEPGPITLPLDMWSEGWAFYVDPYTLEKESNGTEIKFRKEKGDKTIDYISADKSTLEKELKKALADENYELANNIQQRLDKF